MKYNFRFIWLIYNLLLASLEHSFNIFLRFAFANERLISCTSIDISRIGSKASTIDWRISGINGDEEVSWTIIDTCFHENWRNIWSTNEPKFAKEKDNLIFKEKKIFSTLMYKFIFSFRIKNRLKYEESKLNLLIH